jgi:hypothetical protein
MAFITHYIQDGFIVSPGDVISGRLSLAVRLVDDFAKTNPVGVFRVKIKEGDIKARENLSGYYLFLGLVPGKYTIAAESDIYLSEETVVDISVLDPKNPVQVIAVLPAPSYPFPGSATLVRGVVISGTTPVGDAEIKVTSKSMETRTNESGEFVLYFTGIKSESISVEIQKDGNSKTIDTEIEEGKTISMGIIIFP